MGTLMAEARKRRGWTQTRLQHELRAAAGRLGMTLAAPSSLRVTISGWENGRHTPDAPHSALLQEAFGLPAEALGLAEPADDLDADEVALRSLVRRPSTELSPEVSAYFVGQLAEHVRMDNLTGPAFVVDTVVGQLAQVHALPGAEAQRIAARYAEFTGWLLHDSGETTKALRYTDQAVDLAEAAGDDHLSIYNLMRKSNVLSSLGEHQRADVIAGKAVTMATAQAPDLLPVCLRQQALCAARLGDERAVRAAFDRALELADPLMSAEAELSSYCTMSYLQMEAALCWLTLRRPAQAVDACTQALARWPDQLLRDEGLCWARLAVAHVQLRQIDEASTAARATLERVRSAPSARTLHMLQLVATKLAPFNQDRAVRELTRDIAEVA